MSSVSVLGLGAHNMMVVEHTHSNGISFKSTKPNEPNSWVCYHNTDHQLSLSTQLGSWVHGVTTVADSQSHALKHWETEIQLMWENQRDSIFSSAED